MNCDQLRSQNEHCTTCDKRPNTVARENKREYRIENSSRRQICQIKIDGCYVKDKQNKKCDHLFVVCDSGDSYFVELKGRHLLEGVTQISSTLDFFAQQIGENRGNIFARIVVTQVSVPKAIQTDATVLKLRKPLKAWGGDLVYRSGIYTELL